MTEQEALAVALTALDEQYSYDREYYELAQVSVQLGVRLIYRAGLEANKKEIKDGTV